MTCTISVNMPVYNTAKYLPKAIDSILSQTFKDFEFVIVDDGSTDGSGEILEKYAARDPRIRLVRRENRGIGASRNELLHLSQGEFIAVMDSDDIALPERFALQVDFLRQNPDVLLVSGWTQLIDEAGRKLAIIETPTEDQGIQELLLSGHMAICHPTFMMRQSHVAAIGGYETSCVPAEDFDLLLRLGERGRLAALPTVVLNYRLHSQSVSERQAQFQADQARLAAARATQRRGIPSTFKSGPLWRSDGTRAARHEFALRYGWWAFNNKDLATARHYATQALKACPLRLDGWKLLARAIVGPPRNPS